jgi:hypothetical protein
MFGKGAGKGYEKGYLERLADQSAHMYVDIEMYK